MNAAALLQQPLIIALGWTLLHFVWQGAVVALIYALLMPVMRSASPEVRYRVAFGCLMTLGLLPVVTFVHFATASGDAAAATAPGRLLAVFSASGTGAWRTVIAHDLEPYLPWLVIGWFAGVCFASTRMLSAWRRVRDLRRNSDTALAEPWRHTLAALQARLRIRLPVQLAVSTLIRIPMVIGWLKPVILIPPCVLAGLDYRQMEMILAHELAHIRRYDYLVNLLQTVIETLLFYHPAVRWISHQMRLEREKCCDRIVVQVSGDPIAYARALTSLEAIRGAELGWGLGATGGALYDRVRVLVTPHHHTPVSGIAAVLIASAALFAAVNMRHVFPPPAPLELAPSLQLPAATPVKRTQEVAARHTPAPTAHNATTRSRNPAPQPVDESQSAPPRMTSGAQASETITTPVSHAHRVARATAPEAAAKHPAAQLQAKSSAPAVQRKAAPAVTQPVTQPAKAPAASGPAGQTAATQMPATKSLDVPVRMPMPEYPLHQLLNGQGANVIVTVSIAASGAVASAAVVGRSPSEFAAAALDAIRQWQFPAAMARRARFRIEFVTNQNSSCQATTGTRICRAGTLDDQVKGQIRVYAD